MRLAWRVWRPDTMLQYNISGIAPSEVFMLQRDSDPGEDRYDTAQFDRFRVISPRGAEMPGDHLAATSLRASAKPLIRSLMCPSVLRLVSIALAGTSCSTSVAMASRRLS